MVTLKEKSEDHQTKQDSSPGDHECLYMINVEVFHWLKVN